MFLPTEQCQIFQQLLCHILEFCFLRSEQSAALVSSEISRRGLSHGMVIKDLGLNVLKVPCQPEKRETLLPLSQMLSENFYLFLLHQFLWKKSNFTTSTRNAFKLLLIFNMHN